MATPIETGSAARPNQKMLSIHSSTVVVVPVVPNTNPRIRLAMATAAPLASHFSCWRRSPDERRQVSTCLTMKPADKASSRTRTTWKTAPNAPAGLSTADSPPAASMRSGRTASARAIATA